MSAAYSHIIFNSLDWQRYFPIQREEWGHHNVVEREGGTINTSKTILRMGVAVAPELAPGLVGH